VEELVDSDFDELVAVDSDFASDFVSDLVSVVVELSLAAEFERESVR
jgi:hypothetical protein